jgi:hypothetical protein
MPSLFGFAPGGVCHAANVATCAVRSYRTVSPLPCLNMVALSLGLPPPGVTRHRSSLEPGLSSPVKFAPKSNQHSSGHPTLWHFVI